MQTSTLTAGSPWRCARSTARAGRRSRRSRSARCPGWPITWRPEDLSIVAFFWVAVQRNAANGTAAASSQTWAVGLDGDEPVEADRHALGEGQVDELPEAQQRARLEVGQERRRDQVEPDQRMVVEQQRVGLHRARLGVRAGDRLGVDLVAEVRARDAPCAGDQRVGERLERAVGEVRRRERPAVGGRRGCARRRGARRAPAADAEADARCSTSRRESGPCPQYRAAAVDAPRAPAGVSTFAAQIGSAAPRFTSRAPPRTGPK